MCGIVGYFSQNQSNNEKAIHKMNNAIFHRGPDGDGVYADNFVGLGMRRLAIIDIGGGNQPIWNEEGTACIFFNGEIYNYIELRNVLLRDYKFKTNSDTETILAMYDRFGSETPKYLRGMFVFAIYDLKSGELFIARDHFGIKPLYYYTRHNTLYSFASEAKAILEDTRYTKNVNTNAIYNYLQYQYNPLTETFFKDIFTLPPGHMMTVNMSDYTFKIKKYFDFYFVPDESLKLADAEKEIRELLVDSVAHHAIADVTVGSFLSGGIDSSINATLLQQNQKNNNGKSIHTFTIGSSVRNEFSAAKETADRIGSTHHEVVIDRNDYMDSLRRVVWHFDEPVADPSAVLLYLMAGEARKEMKVVLSGEGADEFFGGYNIYREFYDRKKIDILPKWVIDKVLKPLSESDFKFYGKNYLKRYFTPLHERYIGNAKLYSPNELKNIWQGGVVDDIFDINTLYNKVNNQSEPTQMQYIDIHTWLVGDILAKADKMTMAHSLELRVPFLDLRVASYAKRLPDRLKFYKGATKFALRSAFKMMIPTSTAGRKKLGFPTALAKWLKDDIYLFESSLMLENSFAQKFIKESEIEKLLAEHKKGQYDNSRKLFALYMLNMWYEVYFDALGGPTSSQVINS